MTCTTYVFSEIGWAKKFISLLKLNGLTRNKLLTIYPINIQLKLISEKVQDSALDNYSNNLLCSIQYICFPIQKYEFNNVNPKL